MFQDLIDALASKSGAGKVAVLIDEYDWPLTEFFDEPGNITIVTRTLRNFYLKLKSMEEKISFAFMTGACKFSGAGALSL